MFIISSYDDLLIIELNGANNHLYKYEEKFNSFDEAIEDLISYLDNEITRAQYKLQQAQKLRNYGKNEL